MSHRASSPTAFICLCLILSLGPGCASESEAPPPSTVAAPVISPGTGTYSAALDVAITTATSDATIRYTIDGSAPTETAGTVYAGPVPVASSLTLKAVAYRAGWTTSPMTTGQYVIGLPVAAPVFDPGPGAYYDPLDVSLSTSTPGAAIR